MALRWGFASSSRIAHDFMNALTTLNKGEHEVVAVSDPLINFAEDLAKKFGVPKFYGSFLELAQDPNVEIVHVGALNPKHYEVALLMLEHGKHVMVEKPMCTNAKQVQGLITLAKKKNVFLMEGLWPRFLPVYEYIRKQIRDGKLGEIVSVEVEFGNKKMSEFERITKKNLGGSITLDVGCYTIQFCQMVFQQEPKAVKVTGVVNDNGVDVEVNAEISYGDNKWAKLRTSSINTFKNEAKITGTKGTMTVPNFALATSVIDVDGKEIVFPKLPEGLYPYQYDCSSGLTFEPTAIKKCIRAGKTECDTMSLNDSLIVARVEDEIRRQLGVKFETD